MALLQRSLFPDAFEVEDAAVEALEGMEVRKALALLAEARERDPGLVGLDMLGRALAWLAGVVEDGREVAEGVARAWRELPAAERLGLLPSESAAFLDPILARQARRVEGTGPFLDRARTVHRGALRLALGSSRAARELLLDTLTGSHGDRADLWAYLGDACLLEERGEEANACYVRALVISARDVDLFRVRERRLVELHGRLLSVRSDPDARELLLVHAWLEGTLSIPAGNEWIGGKQAGALLAASAGPGSAPERRHRRFALLLYLDRSRMPGEVDTAQREEMATLDPDLFRRIMEACRRRERAGTALLRW